MPHRFDPIRNFSDLPDEAIVPTWVTCAITSLSDRQVRRLFARHYTSRDRYGQQVGDIRRVLKDGVAEEQRRVRVGPAAQRLVTEVQAAPSRAEAEKVIEQFDDSRMADAERERLRALLADALAELPEEGGNADSR
jgi:hypothetical protein